MKTRAIGILVFLLIISIGNYLKFSSHAGIRSVEFISILVIGALAGILLTQIIALVKNKK